MCHFVLLRFNSKSFQIVAGRFPLNKELAFELAALMAQVLILDVYITFFTNIIGTNHLSLSSSLSSSRLQIDMGDLGSERGRSSSMGNPNISEALSRFYPVRYLTQVNLEHDHNSH